MIANTDWTDTDSTLGYYDNTSDDGWYPFWETDLREEFARFLTLWKNMDHSQAYFLANGIVSAQERMARKAKNLKSISVHFNKWDLRHAPKVSGRRDPKHSQRGE